MGGERSCFSWEAPRARPGLKERLSSAFAAVKLHALRTIHSLAPLLARLGFRLFFVAVHDLSPPEELLSSLKKTFENQVRRSVRLGLKISAEFAAVASWRWVGRLPSLRTGPAG